MKAIMISIRPHWVAMILNGDKTIEIRKTMPKCDLPIDVYIYCTQDKQDYLYGDKSVYKGKKETFWCQRIKGNGIVPLLNGKVVAKFTLNKVEELRPFFHWCKELEKETCLTCDEVLDYLDSKDKSVSNPKRQGKVYALHIDNLVFDRPRELSEFKPVKWNKCGVKDKNDLYQCDKCRYASECLYEKTLTKAPQSFMYVEVDE